MNETLPEAQRTQGIDTLTWFISPAKKNGTCIGSKFVQHVIQFALVAYFATRWRHLHKFQIWPPDDTTCISSKFSHQITWINWKFGNQMAPLALVQNLATRWRILHWLQIWPPDGATCIAALPWIALLALSVSIELVSSSAKVTSV